MVSDLLNIRSNSSFYSLINKPIRITDTSAIILDYWWTNLYSENIKTGVLLHPISDHLLVLTCCYTNQIKHELDNKIGIFDQVNIEKFQQKFQKININLILQETDLNTAFCMFIDNYTFIFNQCFFLVKKWSFRKSKNWFDEDLLQLIKEKDKLFKKYIAKQSTVAKAKYKEARNKYFQSIQEKRKLSFHQFLKNKNTLLKKHGRLLTFF